MLVVGYCRFSSEGQRDGYSIEAQKKAINEYCKAEGHTVLRFYVDEAQTGTEDDRESFLTMIDAAKHKEFEAIIVHKLDRFARNRYDSAVYGRMLEKAEVRLISVLEPIVSEDTPEAGLFRGVVETINEYYSKNLGRETLKGKTIAAQGAKHLGGQIPFGYKKDEHGVYTPHPEEAPIVLELYKRLDAGAKLIELARWLKAKGVYTRYNKPYRPEGIRQMVQNPVYTGRYTWGVRSKRKKFEPVVIENAFPAIVDQELFRRVNALIADRAYGPRSRRKEVDYILTGYLYCEYCGRHLYGYKSITRYTNKAGEHVEYFAYRYRCTDYIARAKEIRMEPDKDRPLCKLQMFKKEELEAFVGAAIRSVVFSGETLKVVAVALQERLKKKAPGSPEDLKKVEAQLAALSTKSERLLDLYLDGGIDKAAYTAKRRELEAQVLLLSQEREKLQVAPMVASVESLQAAIEKYGADQPTDALESTKILLATFVDRIEVSNEHIVIYFKFELPNAKGSTAEFSFVRKATSVSTCIRLRTEFPISAVATLDLTGAVTIIL